MGMAVLIIGHSGAGKTTSLRNLKSDEVAIFNVASKPLPFKGKFQYLANHPGYSVIKDSLKKNAFKKYVIDDAGYLMAFENFRRAKESGWGKFTDIAVDFYQLLETIREKTTDDTIVYIIGHIDKDEQGRANFKHVGKMLSSQLCVEGLVPIVLLADTDGKKHWFVTANDGYTTVKSPMGMFEKETIDNDLALVDKVIREYYEFESEGK